MAHTRGPLVVRPARTGAAYEVIPDDILKVPPVARTYRQIAFLGHGLAYDAKANAMLYAVAPDLLEVCEVVAGRTSEAQEIMRRGGFVIDDLGDRWQKLAFTLYTMLATDAAQAQATMARAKAEE